jgi:hypothetical protein
MKNSIGKAVIFILGVFLLKISIADPMRTSHRSPSSVEIKTTLEN